MTKWINVKERLPEILENKLVWIKDSGPAICRLREEIPYWTLIDYDEFEQDFKCDEITHWAELPEPPSEES